MIIQTNRKININAGITKKLLFIIGGIIITTISSCSGRPFGYLLSPMETTVASGWTSTPTFLPTKTPQPTATKKPTNTPAPTRTPRPTTTTSPTQVLPLDTAIRVINQLSVMLSISCEGPYSLHFSISAFETKSINVPSGTYTCVVSATGYSPLHDVKYWTAGDWDWTFYDK